MRCRTAVLCALRAAPSCARPLACFVLSSVMWAGAGCKSFSLSKNTASKGTACVAEADSGGGRICILRKNGDVACIGRGFKTLTTLSGRYVDLDRDCAVRADDGAVACWRGTAPYEPKVKPEFGTGNVEVGDSLSQACVRRKGGSVFCTRAASFGVAASSGVFDDDAQHVAAGVDVACSIDSVGDVACWGDNVHGQLGRLPLREGIVVQWQPAAPVRGLPPNITKLAVGLRHFCALSKAGEVWCWGTLFDERVNTMTQHPCDGVRCPDFIQPTPVRIPLPEPMTDLAGAFGMCAVSRSNEVWCWGHNSLGQVRQPIRRHIVRLPDGEEDDIEFEPIPVRWKELGNDNVKVFGGLANLCALKQNGSLWCWGSNSHLQLDPKPGVGPFKPKPPVPPTELKGVCP